MQIHKSGRTVTLYTRARTDRFPHLAAAFPSLPGSAIIDAELVHPEQDYRNFRYRRVARHQRLLQLVVTIYRWLKP